MTAGRVLGTRGPTPVIHFTVTPSPGGTEPRGCEQNGAAGLGPAPLGSGREMHMGGGDTGRLAPALTGAEAVRAAPQRFALDRQVEGTPRRGSSGKGEQDCEVNPTCPWGRPEEVTRGRWLRHSSGWPVPRRGEARAWVGTAARPAEEGRGAGTRSQKRARAPDASSPISFCDVTGPGPSPTSTFARHMPGGHKQPQENSRDAELHLHLALLHPLSYLSAS